jgi:hypothetical protein
MGLHCLSPAFNDVVVAIHSAVGMFLFVVYRSCIHDGF